jgi:hypothetical protein
VPDRAVRSDDEWFDDLPETLRNRTIDLLPFGHATRVLSPRDAMLALPVIRAKNLAVIGGYRIEITTAGRLTYLVPAWSMKRLPDDTVEGFISRSHDLAAREIRAAEGKPNMWIELTCRRIFPGPRP